MQFTCNTCGLVFTSADEQRIHMKSDWHRYNLKRRVAQLPAIDEDLFNSKVASLESQTEANSQEAKKSNKQLTKKEIRRREKEAIYEQKKQILEIARKNLLAQNEANNIGDEVTAQEELKQTSPETNENDEALTEEQLAEKIIETKLANQVDIPVTTCLFCHPKEKKSFESVDESSVHMFKEHGFYIPEQKYLEDKVGLIKYLGEKIGLGNVCLCCNYQGRNIEAVREHMRIKRHMKIPYEKEDEKLEISQFYDFLSTYDDSSNVVVVEGEDNSEEGTWEDVSDGEAEGEDYDEEDEDELPSQEDRAIYQDGHELVLPSGAVIGHRSMARYYRQNLAPERILSEGQGTVIAAETRHMFNVRDRQELAIQKRAWSRQHKREDQNDRRAQKFINNQPHFRDPLLQ